MVTWPSGKAKVCKTFIHQFKSGRHLHKTVMKKMSQSFFVVSPKIGDFANQFLDTVLQCCLTIFGRFSHPNAHYFGVKLVNKRDFGDDRYGYGMICENWNLAVP